MVLLLTMLLGFVYLMLSQRPAFLFIMDTTYQEISFPSQSRLDLAITSIQNGWFLHVKTVGLEQLQDVQSLQEVIRKMVIDSEAHLVLFSPLVTAVLSQNGPPFEQTERPVLVGMGPHSTAERVYDIALVAQEPDTGWLEAAQVLRDYVSASPMTIALLASSSDQRAKDDAQAFADEFGNDRMLTFHPDSSLATARQVQVTLTRMRDLGVLTVVSPYVESLAMYVGNPLAEGLQWVVEDLYRNIIPSKNLLGTVGDDLVASMLPIFSVAAQGPRTLPTLILPRVRVYRERETGLRSWF
jgi:hypothetical protein